MNEGWTFRLPDVGEGIPEAELVGWRVALGDHVVEGDPLAEVMTDKATVELPSPATGTIEWLGAEPGDLVAVGADLVRFALDHAAPAAPASIGSSAASGALDHGRSGGAPPAPARDDGNGSVPPPVRAADPFAVGDPPPPAAPTRALASPAVRRRARELGIDLASVTGTGPSGRVQHTDLDRELLAHGASGAVPDSTSTPDRDAVDRVELRGLRRSIARNMAASWEEIPHFGYVEEVDVTELLRTREVLEQEWSAPLGEGVAGEDTRAGVLAYVMRAVVLAVADHPEMNARFDSAAGVVERHAAVHLGVAVQTPQGLVVAVVDHAEDRDVRGCASELARLSQAARDGTATLAELSGSTITITSLGSMGGVVSMPIVNHPEVAIIGVNRIVERPVVRDGAVVVRQVMNVSSSFDHRVVDGWDAARFVQRIRTLLETPALLVAR